MLHVFRLGIFLFLLAAPVIASALPPATARAAARVLEQSSFGVTPALLQQVQQEGLAAYLQDQMAQPATRISLIDVSKPLPAYCDGFIAQCADYQWWQAIMTGPDQLRQRVAFALSEIFVVSEHQVSGGAFPYYLNVLSQDAFGNWLTLMKDVTLSTAMGTYLSVLNSGKAPAGQLSNENFARESMQLFAIGTHRLNLDGSEMLDGNSRPVANFTEEQVESLARVYTGWTYANADGTVPRILNLYAANWQAPMAALPSAHDGAPKTVLRGATLPAGQSAEEDLDGALENLFEDPSLPPFFARQMIEHLVTSNPSPEYIARVAGVFINDGEGVRGDLSAVVSAILLDPEARAGDLPSISGGDSFGHLREPILWLTSVFRGLGFTNPSGSPDAYAQLQRLSAALAEPAHNAPSVFNFFPPDYAITGVSGFAPEFALETTATIEERNTLADQIVHSPAIGGLVLTLNSLGSPQDLSTGSEQALVDTLNKLLLHGAMPPQMSQAILDAITPLTDPSQRIRVAVYLVITSPEFMILS